MEELIDQLFEIIKDHRADEGFMTKDRIIAWVNQFATKDRIFVLEETIHILKQRYISEADGKEHVKKMIRYVAKLYKCETVKELVENSYFIDNQDDGKSQGHLLEFLNEILKSEFDTSLNDQNEINPRYILYFDDFLCTGQTIMEGLFDKKTGWLHENTFDERENNNDYIKNGKGELCLCYLAMHKRCINKLGKRVATQGISIGWQYIWAGDFKIENDIEEKDSKLNFLFPTEIDFTDLMENCKDQIEEKLQNTKYGKKAAIQLRDENKPNEETLFSSKENRERYEKIILKRSIEIYNMSDTMPAKQRSRPLGYGLYSEATFGFGTLIFSWRNVPFNTPLVFWYPYYQCTPLFERHFT